MAECKRTVLIVDDDEAILKQMKWALKKEYEVRLAHDGSEALRLFRESPADAVILDLGLPPDPRGIEEGLKTLESLVEEALLDLPKEFKKLIDNLVVIVEDEAGPEVYRQTGSHPFHRILGTYHGVPYIHRGPFYGNILPDRIIIYQNPIEEIWTTDEEIKRRVRSVVIHEIGHYFGLSDLDMEKIEEEMRLNDSKEKK